MENRSLSVLASLIVLLAVPLGVRADSVGSEVQQADWQVRLDKAAALQAEGKRIRQEAGALLESSYQQCAHKFFVNACRKDADNEHLDSSREAHRLDIEGRTLEREVKKEQLAERNRQRAEEAPQREAELQAREAEMTEARQATATKAEQTQADKARRAAEGERRKAADAEKLHQKQAAHEARVAEKRREAERRAAEAAKK